MRLDTTPYGYGVNDSITDTTEAAAITQHKIKVKGKDDFVYGAGWASGNDRSGERTQAVAKIFYVAFTANGAASGRGLVTFFYNGGPGSSCVFLLLGSFGATANQDNGHAAFHSSSSVPAGRQSGNAAGPKRSGVYRSCGHGDTRLRSRRGRTWISGEWMRMRTLIKQFVKRYLTVFVIDGILRNFFWGIVWNAADLCSCMAIARGWRGSEWSDFAVLGSRLFANWQLGRYFTCRRWRADAIRFIGRRLR